MHTEVKHPCIEHKLTLLRDERTDHKQFRELTREITQFVAYEALRNLPTAPVEVKTPLAVAEGRSIAADVVVVPILRAGVGMLDGILALVPNARVGYVGLYRDPETKKPVEYYRKLPEIRPDSFYILIDPMLATGGTTVATLDLLRAHGVKQVIVVCLVASPEGLAIVEAAHPDVWIFTAVVDSHLDERKYIIPGLGDAGDRLFGTR